ncbi:MAG: hypothetical protein WKF80_13415 [Thermomicrobiales bacterium]
MPPGWRAGAGVAGADIRRFSADQGGAVRSFAVGTVAAGLAALANALLAPTLLLAVFVAQLTNSYVLVGVAAAIGAAGFSVGSLVARWAVRGRRKLPWLVGASLVRVAAIALLAFVVADADRLDDDQILQAFFICYTAYVVAAGFGASLATDVATRAVAHGQASRFFMVRGAVAGVVSLIAAWLVWVRFEGGFNFPDNYVALFTVAAVALGVAVFFEARLAEPRRLAGARPATGGAVGLGDRAFRSFVPFGVLLGAAALADPFYILFGFRELGLPPVVVGGYLATLLVSGLVTRPLWTALTRRSGARGAFQAAALLRIAMPLVALSLPYLTETELWRDRATDPRATTWAFGMVFALAGAAGAAQSVATWTFLTAIAPAGRRALFVAPANVILAIVALAPIAGGWAIERWGFEELLLGTASLALAAVVASGALAETVAAGRPMPTAWALRQARQA